MTDEDQLREMQALWAQLNDDKDIEGWTTLYAADGKFVNARGTEFVGHDAIRKNLADRVAAAYPGRSLHQAYLRSLGHSHRGRHRRDLDGLRVLRAGRRRPVGDPDDPDGSTTVWCAAGWALRLFLEVNNAAYVRSTLQWRT